MCALIWLVSAALGADSIVHDGVPGEAVARVSAATGRPASAFEAVTWEALRARSPAVVGGGTVTPCSGPVSTNEQLQWLVQRADGAVAYGETERATTELAEAARVLGCLATPVDPELLARLRTLEGVVAPSGRTRLTVVAPGATVHVDGRATEGPVDVVPGAHVVLIGGASPIPLLVDVPEGAVQVVIPAAFPADLSDADAPSGRAPFAALLAATLGEGAPVFVVTDGAVWAASAGRTDWIALSTQRTSPLHGLGNVAAGVGAVALIGGGVPAALGWSKASSASRRMTDADSAEAFLVAKEDWESGGDLLRPTRWIAVGGGALGALGLGLAIATAPEQLPVAPLVLADGFGVAFQVRL